MQPQPQSQIAKITTAAATDGRSVASATGADTDAGWPGTAPSPATLVMRVSTTTANADTGPGGETTAQRELILAGCWRTAKHLVNSARLTKKTMTQQLIAERFSMVKWQAFSDIVLSINSIVEF